MNVSVIGFTLPGLQLAIQIRDVFLQTDSADNTVNLFCGSKKCDAVLKENSVRLLQDSLQNWAGRQFQSAELVIFIGAAGIAVRAIAPFVKDKKTDPAVLVCDEAGQYVIPILSGHLGGANAYAGFLADRIHATAVITTASDVEGKLALDVWAKRQHLTITDMKQMKETEAAFLRGEKIAVLLNDSLTEIDNLKNLPDNLKIFSKAESQKWKAQENRIGIGLFPPESETATSLWLIPQNLVIGIGCRKGKSFVEIQDAITALFEKNHLPMQAVYALASIDRKAEEPGICTYADVHHLSYRCYSAGELQQVEGIFQHSDFVEQTVGIDNVCERAALRALKDCDGIVDGHLLIEKQIYQGITLAVALGTRRLSFA